MAGSEMTTLDMTLTRAVFISYAREDTAEAQRIGNALRSSGVAVWFDQDELRGGDAWDQKIRRQIKACAVFMPIVSERTQARGEGYFRLEWKLAVERSYQMAQGVPFLAPVVIDGTREADALVPAEFLRVQWSRLPGALPTAPFIELVKRMLEPRRTSVSASPLPPSQPVRPSRTGRMVAAGAAVLFGAVAVAVLVLRRPAESAPTAAPAPAVDSKSIAVLPFANLSEEKDNAYFTDGVHEDILTDLSFIKDLHLTSRTSVMQYRGTTKSIKRIGRELGVAYVLEGSVERQGKKVRVTGQLSDARNDELVWAKAYDRDLTDLFAIQGELAEAIADALKSVLSPETKVLLGRRPTENAAAYDAYLKARQIINSADFGSTDKATPFLERAVALDPNFALAWSLLGSRRALAHFKFEDEAQDLGPAKQAIDRAVRLAPDDPGVIENLGDFYYYAYRDYARATEQYLRLAQLRPNDPAMFYSLGLIQRREGRMADALPNLRLGFKLDPKNAQYALELADTLQEVRHYDEAKAVVRRVLDDTPHDLSAEALLCSIAFAATGSTAEMAAFARETPEPSDRTLHLYMEGNFAQFRGDFAEVLRLNKEQRYYDDDPDNPRWNQDVNAAAASAELGDMKAARQRATEANAELKDEIARQPQNPLVWAAVSLDQALLGHKEEALEAIRRSSDLLPESRDALLGPQNAIMFVYAYVWLGDKDRALAEMDRLLHVAWGLNVNTCRGSFRPLHNDPRFQALLADPRNNAPLF
jgi:TolB-like protein/Tfp pilus assembly protein PilF